MAAGCRFDLVVSDNDGCLVSEGAHAFDLGSLAEIASHNRAVIGAGRGPVLTVCSGRPQPFVEAVCRLLANTAAPAVCENGVWLYHPARNVYELDPTITEADLETVRLAAAWIRERYGPQGVAQQPGKSASVSLYHPDTEYLRSIAPAIADEYRRRGWGLRVSMTWLYINCDLVGVSKGTGMDRLMSAVGTTMQRVAGIGDTAGDMPIRERSAWFACPANAADEIRRVADYVSPFAEARGVVDILRRITEMR